MSTRFVLITKLYTISDLLIEFKQVSYQIKGIDEFSNMV